MKIINIFLTNKGLDVVGKASKGLKNPYNAVSDIDKRLLIFDNSGDMRDVGNDVAIYDSGGAWNMQNPSILFKYFGMRIERDDLCGKDGWKEHINNMCADSDPRLYPRLNPPPLPGRVAAAAGGGYNRRNKTRRNKTRRNKTRRNKTRRNKTRRN